MKPIAILKKFFGALPGQSMGDFLHEMKAFRDADPVGYNECVDLAAKEIGVEVDRSAS